MEIVKKMTKKWSETNQNLVAMHSVQSHFEYFEYHWDSYTSIHTNNLPTYWFTFLLFQP